MLDFGEQLFHMIYIVLATHQLNITFPFMHCATVKFPSAVIKNIHHDDLVFYKQRGGWLNTVGWPKQNQFSLQVGIPQGTFRPLAR